MKLSSLVLLLFAFSAVSAAPAVPQGKAWQGKKASAPANIKSQIPRFTGSKTIVCGNKTIEALPDRVRISCEGRQLADIFNYYVVTDVKTKKVDWGSHTAKLCSVRRDGEKLVWQFKKETKEGTWDSGSMTLEITKDGMLKVSAKIKEPTVKAYKMRSVRDSLWVVMPQSQADGSTVKYNGKDYKLAIKNTRLPGDWRSKKFDFTFYADDPALAFGVTGAKPVIASQTFFALPSTRNFRVTMLFGADKRAGEIYIDLRKSPEKKK